MWSSYTQSLEEIKPMVLIFEIKKKSYFWKKYSIYQALQPH